MDYNGGDNYTVSPQQLFFPAKITAVTGIGGRNVYSFQELNCDPATGHLVTADGTRTGSPTTAPLFELNDISAGVPCTGYVRYRGASGGFPAYDFMSPIASGGGGTTITVREVDGSPSVDANTIEFDQASGLFVTDLGSGVAKVSSLPTILFSGSSGTPAATAIDSIRIDQTSGLDASVVGGPPALGIITAHDASATQKGMVTTGTQTFAGDKTFKHLLTIEQTVGAPSLLFDAGATADITFFATFSPGYPMLQLECSNGTDFGTLQLRSYPLDPKLLLSLNGGGGCYSIIDSVGTVRDGATSASPGPGGLTFCGGLYTGGSLSLTGDVSGSSSGGAVTTTIANDAVTTAKIADGNVTFAKIQNAGGSSRLVGSGSSGSGGNYGEITLGTGLSMSGTTLSVTAGSGGIGTVTSVDVSGGTTGLTTSGGPVTSSGTITLAGTLIVANGGTGRTSLTNHGVLVGAGTSAITQLSVGTDGQLLIGQTGADPAFTSVSGDVTITAGGVTAIGNNKVTTAKILDANVTLAKIANASANSKLLGSGASGSGSSYSEITLGTGLSMTGTTISATGTGGTVTSVDVSGGTTGLTTSGGPVTGSGTITLAGTLIVANGGTGRTSLTNHGVIVGAGTSAVTQLSVGTDGQLLIGQSSADPAFTTVSGDVTITAGGVTAIGSDKVTTSKILNANVTLAKIANASASSKLLGSGDSGSGSSYSEITLGTGLSMTGTTLSGQAGTVTSVAVSGADGISVDSGSPITTSGTIALSLGDITPDNVTAAGAGTFVVNNGTANAVTTVLTLNHDTTGTPANGIGTGVSLGAETSTTADQQVFALNAFWSAVTHASRRGGFVLNAFDSTGARNVITGAANGSAAEFGVFGTSSAQLSSPDVGTALTTFGFASGTPTFACANLTGTVGTSQIAAAAVTLAKIANASASSKLLGSGSSGSGASYSEITLGTGLSMSGTTLSATGTGGDVVGPSSATDNALVRFDGTTGKLVQNSSTTTLDDSGLLKVQIAGTATASYREVLELSHITSNTAAAGFGVSAGYYLESASGTERLAAETITTWATATDASRKARFTIWAYDTSARECLRTEASGTAAMIGFLGASAAVQQTGDVGTAAVTFGLMSGTPTFAAANLTGTTLPASIVTSSLTTVGTIGTGTWQGTKVGLAYGGTNADLSATGGTSQYLKQASSGAAVTVGTIPVADLPALNGFTDADWALDDRLPFYDTSASANRDGQTAYLLGMTHVEPGGRLTLTSGTPVTPTDVTGATSIYYTPYVSQIIYLWDGTRWVANQFSETTLSLGTLVNATGYDVFGYLSSGSLALESLVWKNATITMTIATPCVVTWTAHGMLTGDTFVVTNSGGALPTGVSANTQYWITKIDANSFKLSTSQANCDAGTFVNTSGSQSGTHTGYQSRARQTALSYQDGYLCKSGDKTRLYLGSFWTTATTTTEDSVLNRFLWNMYHREIRNLRRLESTTTWNSTTSSWQLWNTSASNKVQVFRGLNEDSSWLNFMDSITGSGGSASGSIGIGLDSTITPVDMMAYAATGSGVASNLSAPYAGQLGLGYHALYLLQYRETGTLTFYGTAGTSFIQTGAEGECLA